MSEIFSALGQALVIAAACVSVFVVGGILRYRSVCGDWPWSE